MPRRHLCELALHLALLTGVATPSVAGTSKANTAKIDTLVAEVMRRTGLVHAQRWRKRMRWSVLLPQLSARISRTIGSVEYFDLLGATGPAAVNINSRLGLQWSIGVSWRLDRLLLDDREPRFVRMSLEIERFRHELARRLTQLMSRRRQLASRGADSQATAEAADLSAVIGALVRQP